VISRILLVLSPLHAANAKARHWEDAELLAEEVNFPSAKHERNTDKEGQKAVPKKSKNIF
jgi:predicted amidophosphoribosyltransferase